jgi:hypothetical protein
MGFKEGVHEFISDVVESSPRDYFDARDHEYILEHSLFGGT